MLPIKSIHDIITTTIIIIIDIGHELEKIGINGEGKYFGEGLRTGKE